MVEIGGGTSVVEVVDHHSKDGQNSVEVTMQDSHTSKPNAG